MSEKPEQNYKITTPKGEQIFTIPGNRGIDDMRIFTRFPKQPWATSLCYIGWVLRLKGMVEDRNYPNGQGRGYLMEFICRCISYRKTTIEDLCREYKIP